MATVVASAVIFASATPTQAAFRANPNAPIQCTKKFHLAKATHYARRVYRHHDKIGALTRSRLEVQLACQHSHQAQIALRRRIRVFRIRREARKRLEALAASVTPYGAWAIPEAIVMCESHGNFRAVNTSNPARPAGAYQIITDTWLAHGGGEYAPTADAAAPLEQHIVASRIWNGPGRGQWEC